MYTCMYVGAYAQLFSRFSLISLYVCCLYSECMYVYIYVCMYVCMYICMYVCANELNSSNFTTTFLIQLAQYGLVEMMRKIKNEAGMCMNLF